MPHHFFKDLNHDLKHQGSGTPQLIIDQIAYDHNMMMLKRKLPNFLKPRLVVKSLACLELLKYSSEALDTDRFMVFHAPHLVDILQRFPQADILLGKPMPMRVVQQFYKHHPNYKDAKIQWLVDDISRLKQYRHLAEQSQLSLQINVEINIGLHRGGVQHTYEFAELLDTIQRYPDQLKFTGLMGYDAHVAKIPSLIQKPAKSYQQSQDQYRRYQQLIRHYYPSLWSDELCFNGGGSPTFAYHCQGSVCNDLAFGSMLLKPSDFDVKGLESLQCALWIATPVLKVLPYSRVPGLGVFKYFPHRHKALFVYGGYWLADYVYPNKTQPHALYGRSSNQEMVQVPKRSKINVDDYVFLRPHQSEALLTQFESVYVYQHRRFKEWKTLAE